MQMVLPISPHMMFVSYVTTSPFYFNTIYSFYFLFTIWAHIFVSLNITNYLTSPLNIFVYILFSNHWNFLIKLILHFLKLFGLDHKVYPFTFISVSCWCEELSIENKWILCQKCALRLHSKFASTS